jgi:hypothetical protein
MNFKVLNEFTGKRERLPIKEIHPQMWVITVRHGADYYTLRPLFLRDGNRFLHQTRKDAIAFISPFTAVPATLTLDGKAYDVVAPYPCVFGFKVKPLPSAIQPSLMEITIASFATLSIGTPLVEV